MYTVNIRKRIPPQGLNTHLFHHNCSSSLCGTGGDLGHPLFCLASVIFLIPDSACVRLVKAFESSLWRSVKILGSRRQHRVYISCHGKGCLARGGILNERRNQTQYDVNSARNSERRAWRAVTSRGSQDESSCPLVTSLVTAGASWHCGEAPRSRRDVLPSDYDSVTSEGAWEFQGKPLPRGAVPAGGGRVPCPAMAVLPLLLMVPALGSFLFTFGTGVELIRFVSLRALFLQLPTGAEAPQPRASANSGWAAERGGGLGRERVSVGGGGRRGFVGSCL